MHHLNLGVREGNGLSDNFLLAVMIAGTNPEAFLVDEGHLVFQSTNPDIVKVTENVEDPDRSQCGWQQLLKF